METVELNWDILALVIAVLWIVLLLVGLRCCCPFNEIDTLREFHRRDQYYHTHV